MVILTVTGVIRSQISGYSTMVKRVCTADDFLVICSRPDQGIWYQTLTQKDVSRSDPACREKDKRKLNESEKYQFTQFVKTTGGCFDLVSINLLVQQVGVN